MRFQSSWLSLLRLASIIVADPILRPRDYDSREYYALQLAWNAQPSTLAKHLELQYEGPLGELKGYHLFSRTRTEFDAVMEYMQRYRKRDSNNLDIENLVIFSEKQSVKKLHKRLPPIGIQSSSSSGRDNEEAIQRRKKVTEALEINDPIFNDQWHLFNVQQPGHDLNVTALWLEGITGYNATVAIVDDGLDMDSLDLKANYFAKGSYDFNDPGPDPRPQLDDDNHGTRCAGEIAAVKNDVCGVGVAWSAKIAGIRILSKQISDADEAIALNYGFQDNQIYSCSWGPPDNGEAMEAPGILIKKAMLKGVQDGRQGLGSVFVFASGNGAGYDDNCNFDGYTNSIYSITVGAVDRQGKHPYYSELCSAQMVVAYSSGSGASIHTTDTHGKCFRGHGGTSAAAPLAAGVYALVLSIRPELSWRDMQYLTMETAVPVDLDDLDWDTTAIGKKFNHKYGYGKIDAYAIVKAAKQFKLVKPQAWYHSPTLTVNKPIPEGGRGLKMQMIVSKNQIEEANIERIEHVTIRMNAKHSRRGDMSVDLISPAGIVSHISTARRNDQSSEGYRNWDFMTVKHWGEDGIGTWTIVIRDEIENQHQGSLVDWSITLWGEAKDANKAELYPMPGESGHHTIVTHPVPFSSIVAVTTTAVISTSTTAQVTGNPPDHVHRPVNSKISSPSDAATSNGKGQGSSSDELRILPSFMPTFGVSAKTQVWIYGSIAVISTFVALVAVYVFRQRRKEKARQDGRNYEFQPLGTEDAEELMVHAGHGTTNGSRRKARDLYDAFGASDDDEFSSDGDVTSDTEDNENGHGEKEYEEAYGLDQDPRKGSRQNLLSRVDQP